MSEAKKARPEHPVHELIGARWSPYGYSDRPVSDTDLRSLFEAARWAASSYNEQPWSFLVARKSEHGAHETMLRCLVAPNRAWAKAAPVLALTVISNRFSFNGEHNRVALHDLGLAMGNLCFEATARGIAVHQMGGILPDRARELYQVPEDHEVATGVALGYPAELGSLEEGTAEKDSAPRSRKALGELVFTGRHGAPAPWL